MHGFRLETDCQVKGADQGDLHEAPSSDKRFLSLAFVTSWVDRRERTTPGELTAVDHDQTQNPGFSIHAVCLGDLSRTSAHRFVDYRAPPA